MQHPGDATADQPADDAGYPKQQHEEKAEKARTLARITRRRHQVQGHNDEKRHAPRVVL
jgi:hypothetical protein